MINYRVHENGGGLVAETAKVEKSVHVGEYCTVHDRAVVIGNVKLLDSVQVYDNAVICGDEIVMDGSISVRGNSTVSKRVKLFGSVQIYHDVHLSKDAVFQQTDKDIMLYGWCNISGGKWHRAPLVIQGSIYHLNEDYDGKVVIGCTSKTIEDWRIDGPLMARLHDFSDEDVQEYEAYLNLFESHFKRLGIT